MAMRGDVSDTIEILHARQGDGVADTDAEILTLGVNRVQVWAVGVLAVVVAVLLLGIDRQPEQAAPNVAARRTASTQVPATTQTSSATFEGNVLASDVELLAEPFSRDPSYVGRPGDDKPVRAELIDKTLLYVNEFGRPTIVDFSTGDQREVLIDEGRTQDRFEVEFGQIVTSNPGRSDLPLSMGRSFVVTGMKAGSDDDPEKSLVICIDGPGCRGETILGNTEVLNLGGTSGDRATKLDAELGAQDAIARLLGVDGWSTNHRWTLFGAVSDEDDGAVKMPTPHPEAVVWLISQTR